MSVQQSAKPAKGSPKPDPSKPFLSDVTELRRRAKESIDKGAVTSTYEGDVQQTIDLLQTVLATEMVCVMRYTMHSIAAEGINSASVAAEFKEHAKDEKQHELMAANRIDQLGGVPNYNPDGLLSRAATEYGDADKLVDMIKENLVAERIVIEHYQELIRFFGDKDPTTRRMMEKILEDEEDHATDMHDLLVAAEGQPFLKS